MSRPPDYMYKMSEKLSEVMDDIGVNEKHVMECRRICSLSETLMKFQTLFYAKKINVFVFGSQVEGSKTRGLRSDIDQMHCEDYVNVIQHMWEWKPGCFMTVMVIQNENISPGYCYLQILRPDIPLQYPANVIQKTKYDAIDSEGRMLWSSNWEPDLMMPEHGPALTTQLYSGVPSTDIVYTYCCKSSPLQATSWLQKLTESKWPSEDFKTFCRNAGCFLVSARSRLSDMPELEWRISTSLQERCLMFSLNITQLRCYVLMKMMLKTHIHPYVEDVLSSFMCKNVLLYCVYNSSHESSQEWHTGNLLSYLHLCLFILKECILQRNCPHLMIPENNLLTGRMTDAQRGKLLDIIDNLMESKEELLYKIEIDDLGSRLKMKLNIIHFVPKLPPLMQANFITQIASTQSHTLMNVLSEMNNESLEVTQQIMSEYLSDLKKYRAKCNLIKQNACDLLIPLVKSTLGSVMASININAQAAISDEAFTYLEAGRESDVLSGRLKLVSVLYCTGDNERAECELKISQKQWNRAIALSFCACYPNKTIIASVGFLEACDGQNEEAIKFLIVFCIRFLKNEMNCVPHELRYEILKSYIEEDRQMRTWEDLWMDFIAVDSVPYLYFLLYKTYGRLQRRTDQLEAIHKLWYVAILPVFNHKETSLNLLGQCMEQENLQAAALECYIRSLQHRERNNAARFLMCIQLMKLWKKYNV